MTERELPKIGTAAWIVRDGKVLLGKRRKGSGEGTWCPPGGHLEMHESFEMCLQREAMEEAGIEIENIRFIVYTNDHNQEGGKHYVTMHFAADLKTGEPQDFPHETIGEWGWYSWDHLPGELFHPARIFKENGYNPLNF